MFLQIITIARTTFIEAARQPVLLLMVLLSGILQVFNTWSTGFAMGMEETSEVVGDNKLLLDVGLATIFVFGAVLAGFLATAVMSREIENKTVLTIVSKPVPRPVLVLGKYVGVTFAILGAMLAMLAFLLMAIRHGVMSTASDELDGPVLLFSLSMVGGSLLLAAWCNFFYGWNFCQTAMTLLVPLTLIGYFAILMVSKKWEMQSLGTDFKPQVTIACSCLILAVMVLCAVGVAASTRLGQVMTIVVCFGVFVLSLFSNFLFGRHVFRNELLGTVAVVRAQDPTKADFNSPESIFSIRLETPPRKPMPPGTPLYYGPSPSGFPLMAKGTYIPYKGDLSSSGAMSAPGVGPAIIVTDSKPPYQELEIRNIGATPVVVMRPPERGDYVFTQDTKTNLPALGAWGAIPNLQFYWLLDAVSQNRPVSATYLGVAALYACSQIAAFLSLGIVLFQRRDVG
jgi:ABC-type transport system involved in multi-copper enzyme maturation permease subunit